MRRKGVSVQHNLAQHRAVKASQDLYKVEDEPLMMVDKEKGEDLSVAKTAARIQQSSRERLIKIKHMQVISYFGLMLGDGFLLITLLALVLILIPYLPLGLRVSVNDLGTNYAKLIWDSLAVISWVIATRITNAYETLNATYRLRSVLNVTWTLTLMLIIVIVMTSLFFTQHIVSYVKIGLFFFTIAIAILTTWRVLFTGIMRSPRFRPQAVILGTTTAGKTMGKELLCAKRPPATILGYISENTDAVVGLQEDSIPILGGRESLRGLCQSGMIDMIITAVDYHMYPELFRQVIEIAQLGVSVVPMPIAYENMSGKIPVEHIGDQWYLSLPLKVALSPLYICWRKVVDLIFGFVGTAVLLLILPILALLLYRDSPGPIFYSQERLGLQGKPFRIYKFRSMRTDAEQDGQAIWATENDTRTTSIGRFMRATHLDELPQMFNILRGDMSLIGPRPEREEFAAELEKSIPFYNCRLAVKPGLTGWAQVKYHYGRTVDDTLIKLQFDLYYIKHQSFILDIFIILMTFVEVFLHRGT